MYILVILGWVYWMNLRHVCRHCVMNCGPVLTERMWQISISAIQQAFDVTLFYLRQLMTPFHENSDNFYGDVGQVKVAVRLDSTSAECDRLQQLGQQVRSLKFFASSRLVVFLYCTKLHYWTIQHQISRVVGILASFLEYSEYFPHLFPTI